MLAKVSNGHIVKYPFPLYELKGEFSNVSFPDNIESCEDILAQYGVAKVHPTEKPEHNPYYEDVRELDPVFKNGKWHQAWEIIPLSNMQSVEQIKSFKQVVKSTVHCKLEEFAMSKGYFSFASLVSYKDSTVEEWKEDAECAIKLRDTVWKRLFEIFQDIDNGSYLVIDEYDVLDKLPNIN